MSEQKQRAQDFLKRHGMHIDDVDVSANLIKFEADLESGLNGQPSSLAAIPTYVECDGSVPVGQPVIVLDAGGTNLRVCTVTFDAHGEATIAHFSKHRMPGIEKEISAEEFYNTLCDLLMPVIDLSDRIGFCFSYPTEISPEKDGKLIHWTKEVKVPEVVGKYIGQGVIDALASRGKTGKEIVILNDTVACLLAGKAVGDERHCEDYIGFILGTGTNTAYMEKNNRIGKLNGFKPKGRMAVNLESGGFQVVQRGRLDEGFDATTVNPGGHTFEKMISGAYLGPLSLFVMKKAAEEGLLSEAAASLVTGWDELSTKDMDDFLGNPWLADNPFNHEAIGDTDREFLVHLFSGLVARAALLTAINMTGTILRSGAGKNPLRPVCINVDGSTYHKTNGFEHKVEAHLYGMLTEQGVYYESIQVDNAPVIGAAIAGLIG